MDILLSISNQQLQEKLEHFRTGVEGNDRLVKGFYFVIAGFNIKDVSRPTWFLSMFVRAHPFNSLPTCAFKAGKVYVVKGARTETLLE